MVFWSAKLKKNGRDTSTETHVHYEGHSMVIDIALHSQSDSTPLRTNSIDEICKDYNEFVTLAIRVHSHLVDELKCHRAALTTKVMEEQGSRDEDDDQVGGTHQRAKEILCEKEIVYGPDWEQVEDRLEQLAAEVQRTEAEYEARMEELCVLGVFDEEGELLSEDKMGKPRFQDWGDNVPVEENWEHVKRKDMMYYDDGMGMRCGESYEGDSYDLEEVDRLTQDSGDNILRSVASDNEVLTVDPVDEESGDELVEGCSEGEEDEETCSSHTLGEEPDIEHSQDDCGLGSPEEGQEDSFPRTEIYHSQSAIGNSRASSFPREPKPEENCLKVSCP